MKRHFNEKGNHSHAESGCQHPGENACSLSKLEAEGDEGKEYAICVTDDVIDGCSAFLDKG